ncbi:pyridoxine 5'-phosphate synthase [Reichenbachiella versicolor]|uniref:pyridoxine 5'-phosphate synthase n=1 Tax=Reichenbachiella versicolor TaxID=1821036 RepID=UPI000D6E9690|nr:pyridoxine 5'-phosphate synthase [Reichenbachiella versicolor]
MTKLSVNVNKIATIRNARGGNNPNLIQVVKDCERFGAQGITVHPRPDERHITTQDVYDINEICTTEFNIEGYPDERYIKMIEEIKPQQATLVPDPPEAITSNAGWDTIKNKELLSEIILRLKATGTRVSIFVEPDTKMIEGAAEIKTDRIELYTEPYAELYPSNKKSAIKDYLTASLLAKGLGLGINAGHDLDLNNLKYLKEQIPFIDEVSIGHALVCDALYSGLENTIQMYLRQLI